MILEFRRVPDMDKNFTKLTYRGYTMPLKKGRWYYGQDLETGNLCVTNSFECGGRTQIFIQYEKGKKYTEEWLNLYDDNGNQQITIAEPDLTNIMTDIKDNISHSMDIDDWCMGNGYDAEYLRQTKKENLEALEKDYQYYLYMGWKYPYFVRKIAEKCMGKNI